MNRKLLILGIGMLFMASCTKEPVSPEPDHPQSANIQLSQAEIERLPLLSDNHRRSQEQVIGIVEAYGKAMPETITKTGRTLAITDSLVFADAATKAGGVDAAPIYVVSFGEGAGFALVGGDNRLPMIMGIIEKGDFSKDDNVGFDIMMERMQKIALSTIAYKETLRDSVYDALRIKLGYNGNANTKVIDPFDPNEKPGPPDLNVPEGFNRTEIVERDIFYEIEYQYGPLLKTHWGQGYPYNYFLPQDAKAFSRAVSIAQIMAYYKYPIYNPETGSHYDWHLMKNYASETWSFEGVVSVANLIRDLGNYLSLHYNVDYYKECLDKEFISTLDKVGYHTSSSKHIWFDYNVVHNEVKQNRPVHIDGTNGKKDPNEVKGYEWVIDGSLVQNCWATYYVMFYRDDQFLGEIVDGTRKKYSQRMLHNNFGRDGLYDSWLGGETITTSDIPDANDLNKKLGIVTEIYPKQ